MIEKCWQTTSQLKTLLHICEEEGCTGRYKRIDGVRKYQTCHKEADGALHAELQRHVANHVMIKSKEENVNFDSDLNNNSLVNITKY